jgi:hypothetical protein
VTECTGQQVLFSIGKKRVTTVFDGGNLTSDSGVLFLNRIDERLGLSRLMAEVLSDRVPGREDPALPAGSLSAKALPDRAGVRGRQRREHATV